MYIYKIKRNNNHYVYNNNYYNLRFHTVNVRINAVSNLYFPVKSVITSNVNLYKFSELRSIDTTSSTIDNFFNVLQEIQDNDPFVKTKDNITERFIFQTKLDRYPILQVTRKFGNKIGINRTESYTQKLWMYVTFITQENNIPETTWLTPNESIIYLNDINENHWIIVNVQQIGEYKSINDFISIV